MNQIELEREVYSFGRERAARIIERNEEKGRASNNPYAQALYRRFVKPLAMYLEEDLEVRKGKAGRYKAHAAVLRELPFDVVAVHTVRAALTNILSLSRDNSSGSQSIAYNLGQTAYHEYILSKFQDINPALFHTLISDLGRKRSKNERHRMTVFKMQAKSNGIEFEEWSTHLIFQVGAYLLEALAAVGMVVNSSHTEAGANGKPSTKLLTVLAPSVCKLIESIKGFVIETMPYHLPCIEQPKDWVAFDDGGYHTMEMRRLLPYAVSHSASMRDHYREADLTPRLQTLNALQATRWRVNGKMLDTITEISKRMDVGEILSHAELPAPRRPEFLEEVDKAENMSPEQLAEFTSWKRDMAIWYTEMKLRGVKWGRYNTAMTTARKFRDYEAIYFVYFLDYRGRAYCLTSGISPQGSDIQKALIQFADGEPLDTPEAIEWFLASGATRFGFDKAWTHQQAEWVRERSDMILSFADDPLANRGWSEADKPLQFLAWCFEYAEFIRNPEGFVSYLPVGMDGSCNGLQHFSAIFRDELGGKATNLVPAERDVPASDIYGEVAAVVIDELGKDRPDDTRKETMRLLWLQHGITRNTVKRPVMTLPYGANRFSFIQFILEDYMRPGHAPEFEKTDHYFASSYLAGHIDYGIGKVVVKAKEAMEWLQESADKAISEGHKYLHWTTPDGFPVLQAYWEVEEYRIQTVLNGCTRIKAHAEIDEPRKGKHVNGIVPNFVHSLDSCHMSKVVLACKREGIDNLAMIHDDFGTHARFAPKLFNIIREEFVDMYASDPLEGLIATYNLTGAPSKGTLDLEQVKLSHHFFK